MIIIVIEQRGDGCTYYSETIHPIEYLSEEQFLIDFENYKNHQKTTDDELYKLQVKFIYSSGYIKEADECNLKLLQKSTTIKEDFNSLNKFFTDNFDSDTTIDDIEVLSLEEWLKNNTIYNQEK
jgi:hypothetical protein